MLFFNSTNRFSLTLRTIKVICNICVADREIPNISPELIDQFKDVLGTLHWRKGVYSGGRHILEGPVVLVSRV